MERMLHSALGIEDKDEDHLLPPPQALVAESEVTPSQPSESPVAASEKTMMTSKEPAPVQARNLSAEIPPSAQIAESKANEGLDLDAEAFPIKAVESPKPEKPFIAVESSGQEFPEPRQPKEALKKYLDQKRNPEMEVALIPPRPKANPKESLKEKISGVIGYITNETVYQSASQKILFDLAERLKKNPNESVMLQGQLADGEAFDLVQMRFGFIKTQLEKMNIQADRIILDEKRTVGDWPEFKMFILRL
jgi:outer membrane protein OmpA-like peptidoglycan-associated protein